MNFETVRYKPGKLPIVQLLALLALCLWLEYLRCIDSYLMCFDFVLVHHLILHRLQTELMKGKLDKKKACYC